LQTICCGIGTTAQSPSGEPDHPSPICILDVCIPENYARNHFASLLHKYYSHDWNLAATFKGGMGARADMELRLETLERKREDGQINWVTAGFMMAFHLGAIAALFFFTWKALATAIVLWWISGSLGIGMGYHRLLTHRGYKTPKWVEYFLTVCATLALEGGPIFWVATHRIHHQFSDKEGDPHSPIDGKWWAHMGWILMGKSLHQDTQTLSRYVPDLAKSKFHVWITKYHYVPVILMGVALFAIGGAPFLFWGLFVRTVFGLHSTWLVNSATHSWGTRRFATRDLSTNSWWVALVTFGEGWHNNHHAHPVSARHGLKWYEIDLNWYGIWTLKKLGLARHVYRVKLDELREQERAQIGADESAAAVTAQAELAST
jgi:stearoyl-CoA desaturase (delta-9 desaturase)